MEIGDRIKNERKKRNISQQQLADYLNISRQAVSRWENNISLPDLNTLVLIAKYFDLKLEYFTEDIILERTEESQEELIEESIEELKGEPEKELEKTEEKSVQEKTIEKATPYILVLTAIVTMILLLPSKVKVPVLFFGLLFIIFFVSCLLIYYIIKNYLSQN